MNRLVQAFCFVLIFGSAFAGGKGRRYNRGAAAVYSSEPVYQKTYSSPLVYAKSVGVPAAIAYAAPAAQYISNYPGAYAYAAPSHGHVHAAPHAHLHAAPHAHHHHAAHQSHAHLYAAPQAHLHSGHHHAHHAHAHHHSAPHAHLLSAPHAHLHSAPAALTYAQPVIPAAPVALLSTAGKPQTYQKSIPAAAIRNIETVMVTKTITPVVTKTTTHHTSAEPALSLGHVQGYSQAAVGHPKLAPVHFDTQYTSYANPTVGVNGPVVYSGGAVGVAQLGVAAGSGVVAAVPEPVLARAIGHSSGAVYKTHGVAVQAAPAVYKTASVAAAPAAYSFYPGAALSYENYGLEAHSLPISNFLEVQSGKAVHSGYHK